MALAWVRYLSYLLPIALALWGRFELRSPARVAGSRRIVEYPLAFRVATVGNCLLITYLVLREFPVDGGPFYGYFFLPLYCFAVPLARFSFSGIRFDHRSLVVTSTWRRLRTIPLDSILGVRGGVFGWVIETRGSGRIGFNPYQRGCRELLASIRAIPSET
jgi:hypothetical protein